MSEYSILSTFFHINQCNSLASFLIVGCIVFYFMDITIHVTKLCFGKLSYSQTFALSLLNSCIHPQFFSWDKVPERGNYRAVLSDNFKSDLPSPVCLLGPWATEFPCVQIQGPAHSDHCLGEGEGLSGPTLTSRQGLKVTYSKARVFHPLSLWIVCFPK